MIWGRDSVTAEQLQRAKAAGRTLLAFNEPDLAGQASMSVETALDLWPQLQATGVRLGAPAVAYGGDGHHPRTRAASPTGRRRVHLLVVAGHDVGDAGEALR
jgi:hypothetical protein